MTATQVEDAAMALTPGMRAKLVDRLLMSLSGPASPDIDDAWAREVEARIDEFDAHGEKGIPASQVLRSLKRGNRKCR